MLHHFKKIHRVLKYFSNATFRVPLKYIYIQGSASVPVGKKKRFGNPRFTESMFTGFE